MRDIPLTAEGAVDPVMSLFAKPDTCTILHHGDVWTLPKGGVMLAQTHYPQAFRFGSALGVQVRVRMFGSASW